MVRGAVIHGVEKEHISNLTKMTACPQNYGVRVAEAFSETKHPADALIRAEHAQVTLANDQMKWLMRKGDVILSDKPREIVQSLAVEFTEASRKLDILIIYSYPYDEDVPDTYDTAHTGQSSDSTVAMLTTSRTEGSLLTRV